MTEWMHILLSYGAGILLGAIFFGGLWLTVAKGISSRWPSAWFLLSLLLRVTVVATGFYFATGGQFGRLLACLVGFITARTFITTRLSAPKRQIPLPKESSHDQS